MAEFSSQYSQKYLGFEGDFCIFQEAKKLKKETYTNLICEGYGFVALGKDENGDVKLAIPRGDLYENVEWIGIEDLGIKQKKKLFLFKNFIKYLS